MALYFPLLLENLSPQALQCFASCGDSPLYLLEVVHNHVEFLINYGSLACAISHSKKYVPKFAVDDHILLSLLYLVYNYLSVASSGFAVQTIKVNSTNRRPSQ